MCAHSHAAASKGALRPLTRVCHCIQVCLTLRTPPPRRGLPRGERHLLRDVSGAVYPGQLMAILGATGSGKSSIMNILARRLVLSSRLSVSGTVRLNGAPRGRRWKSSFCEQTDLFLSTLTVEETLLFSARLRMPSTSTPQSRQARVDAVLRTLGLGKVAHTKVGGDLMRGISGGEAKRLALGVEMVVNPPLLFMDEPTSGLDAFNAQSLMATLSVLTTTGRTIVVCIHQPRSGITAMFDALLLLSEGRVMWSGQAGDQPVAFLEGFGFRLPAHTNPSDFFLDVVSVAYNTPETERVTRERIDMIADAYKARQPEALAQLRDSASAYGKDSAGDAQQRQQQPQSAISHQPWYVEFSALLFRAGRLKGRQNLENGINLVRTTVFSLLLGLIWLHVGKRAARDGNPGAFISRPEPSATH